jgi:hypothetical protein
VKPFQCPHCGNNFCCHVTATGSARVAELEGRLMQRDADVSRAYEAGKRDGTATECERGARVAESFGERWIAKFIRKKDEP